MRHGRTLVQAFLPTAPRLFSGVLFSSLLALAALTVSACSDGPAGDSSASRPAFKPDPQIVELGRRLFRKSNPAYGCTSCHGLDARGSRMGPSLRKAVPVYFERYNHDPDRILERLVEHLKDPDIFPAIGSARDFIAPMPLYDRLPPEELTALATFVMSLDEGK